MFKSKLLGFSNCQKKIISFLLHQDAFVNFLLLIFIVLSIKHQYILLGYREWGDESETIVAAKMIATGLRLYSEIFNHHGPLTFLPGIILEKFGSFGIAEHRVSIAILQILAVTSIYMSPIFKFKAQRVLASLISITFILSFMPEIYGHMYKYQTIAGILLVIILAQYTIPAILYPENVSQVQSLIGAALIVSLPFLAINYILVACFLFIASWRSKNYKTAIWGSFAGIAANFAFLMYHGSIAGYFAFHVYLNAKVLPLYGGLEPGLSLAINVIKGPTSDLVHYFSFICILPGLLLLAEKEKYFSWRTALLFIGIISFFMRGTGFHSMPYFYAILPLIALGLTQVEINKRATNQILIIALLLCIFKVSLIFPEDRQKIESSLIPKETEFSKIVTKFTTPQDKIIAYSFQNFQYIVSDRLPASGHFFYLPWQEKYNEKPKFGILINPCKQIKEASPKIMLIDKWKVWDRFSWDSYAGCVQDLLDSNYIQIPEKPFYVRRDLYNDVIKYLQDLGQ